MTTTQALVIDRSESQLEPRAPLAPAASEPITALSILDKAIKSGMSPEALEKLVAMSERVAARAAAAEFAGAMAEFKRTCKPVLKTAENQQFTVNRNGAKVPRRYASLEDIERTIREPLGAVGLSYRWGSAVMNAGTMTVSCIVSHVGGHSVESSVTLPVASSAGCSEIQKYGSAMTYAQRYSLVQALGLTTCDEDRDGNDEPDAGPAISEHQAANLDALIADVGADKRRFLAHFGIEAVADLPASRFAEACKALESKRKASK